MNKSIDLTQLGGLFIYQDTLKFLQDGYTGPLDAFAKAFGDKVIVTGMADGGATVTDGWAVVNGELLPFVGGVKADYVYVETVTGDEQFNDATTKTVYTTKQLKFTASSSGTIPFTDFKRLPYNSADINASLNTVKTLFKNIVIETAVILSGCAVSGVGGGSCSIATGIVLMDGEYIASPAYTGVYPVYLKPDATYTTVLPGSGNYIKFDYETSQRYVDVLRRNTHNTGSIVLHRVLSDRFDIATGLGKWEWLGWKINDDMRSRVPVGYDRRSSDPADGVYDTNYHTILTAGAQQNAKTIAKANLPNITLNVTIPTGSTATNDGGSGLITMGDGPNEPVAGPTLHTEALGSGTALDTRSPYRVILYLEKI